MASQHEARFYPNGSSQCIVVNVQLGENHVLRVQASEPVLNIEVAHEDLVIHAKIGSVPREIIVREHGLLVAASDTILDQWLDGAGTPGRMAKLEKNKLLILFSTVLVPAALYCIFTFVIPQAAIVFADYVPDKAVHIASQQTLRSFEHTILSDSQLDEAVQTGFKEHWLSLTDSLGFAPDRFHILFKQSTVLGANAFALPNGTIVITDALVNLVDQDKQLLSAILLHEIGHVAHKHSMRLVAETLSTSLVMTYFFSDLDAVLDLFVGVSNTVLQNKFSQTLEWEADNYAISQLQKLGLSPSYFADAMRKLASISGEESSLDKLLSSHPLLQERIDNALEAMPPVN
jgi:Zn-dependent protease with chaperone function